MADPTPTPTPSPTPTPPTRKSPGLLDARRLQNLTDDENTIRAAIDELKNDPVLAAALATHFLDRDNTIAITPASLGDLLVLAGQARAAGGGATTATAEVHNITTGETDNEKTAVAAIRNVGQRAKEKYEETHPDRLAAYYVGQSLGSRSAITQAGAAIWKLIRTRDDDGNPVPPEDTLPGYDQTKIDQFKADLGDYLEVETAQSGAQSDATGGRGSFQDLCDQVARRRRKVQLAFDSERPHSKANIALRTRLGLPTDKGMS